MDPISFGKGVFYAGVGIASLVGACRNTENTYSTTRVEVDPSIKEEINQKNEKIQNLESDIEEMKNKNDSISSELNLANRNYYEMKRDNENLEAKNNKLQNDFIDLRENKDKELKKISDIVNEKNNEIRNLKEQNTELINKNEERQRENEILNYNYNKLNNEKVEMENKLKNSEKQNQNLREVGQEQKRVIEKQKMDLENKNVIIKEKDESIKEYKIKVNQKEKLIDSYKTENEGLKEDIKKKDFIKKENERKGREAKEKFERMMIKERDKIIEEKKEKIQKEIEEFSKSFIMPEDSINALLKNIIQTQRKKLVEKYTKNIENYHFNGNELKHFNILICGLNGAGKSTLINSLLGANVAETGIGESKTKKIQSYESKNLEGYRFYDTAGLNSQNNLEYSLGIINSEIQKHINDLDKAIHCIWYCTCSNRFNREEFINFLYGLMSNYENKIPLIIVYTQAWDKKDTEDMIKEIKAILKEAKDYVGYEEEIEIIDIIALEKKLNELVFPSKNLDKLLQITNKKIVEATQSSCYELLKSKIKTDYNKIIKEAYATIKNQINEGIKNYIQKISEDLTYDEMFSIAIKLFYNICYDFFDKTFDINEVDFVVKKFFEELRLNSEETMIDFISKKTEKITEEISAKLSSLQVSIDKEYEENMKNKKETNDFIRENREYVKNKINYFIEKRFLKFYLEKLFDKITYLFNYGLVRSFENILKKQLSEKIKNIAICSMNSFCKELKSNIDITNKKYIGQINKKRKNEEKKLKEIQAKKEEENDDDY